MHGKTSADLFGIDKHDVLFRGLRVGLVEELGGRLNHGVCVDFSDNGWLWLWIDLLGRVFWLIYPVAALRHDSANFPSARANHCITLQ